MTTAQPSNVVYLETLIGVPDTSSITDDPILAVYEAVVAMQQKVKAQNIYIEQGIEILKKHMGDSEVLISKDGRRIATWKQQYKQVLNDVLFQKNFPAEYEACCTELDVDMLKNDFPEEYELCCETKNGNKPFCLK